MVIDGKRIAGEMLERLAHEPRPRVFLVAILVGQDPSSVSFVRQKGQTARALGVDFRVHKMGSSSHTDGVASAVRAYVADPACGGIVVQLPLPPQVSRAMILSEIPLEKDVDVIGNQAVRAFQNEFARVLPPAVGVVEKILTTYNMQRITMHAAVLGANGFLVGQPVARWLEGKVANLVRIDIGDDHSPIAHADLVVSCTGQPGILKPDQLKDSAVVIDFGYGSKRRNNEIRDMNDGVEPAGRDICGDLDTSSDIHTSYLAAHGITYTPTPGGTGPILVAQLFENFYTLNQ